MVNTKDVEQFRIISEAAISAGTRRIEAIAGTDNVNRYEARQIKSKIKQLGPKLNRLNQLIEDTGSGPDSLVYKALGDLQGLSLRTLTQREKEVLLAIKTLEKRIQKQSKGHAKDQLETLEKYVKPFSNTAYSIFCHKVDNVDLEGLRTLSEDLMGKYDNMIIIMGAEKENKGYFLVKLASAIVQNSVSAPAIIKQLTEIAGGGGGGRPDVAQAGGVDPNKIQDALVKIEEALQSILG